MAENLSGKALATAIRADVAERAAKLTASGVTPALAIVVATDDDGTLWYVRSIVKAAEKVGVRAVIHTVDDPTADAIAATLTELAADDDTHGIILQTPLPEGVSLTDLAHLIPAAKDIDGASPVSAGNLVIGTPAFAPATAEACLELLAHHGVPLSGKRAVVIGRSAVVGKPVAQLLLRADATVTVTHSRTVDLPAVARTAEVLVVAIGRADFVTVEHVSPGAVVIDVGTNTAADGSLVGDVEAASVDGVAGGLSPVPGGVGPVTTALLLRHAVAAAEGGF
ncbi:bifunctional 5,10-methylenetetrahydrofolate dehydrogenase/5,10-methenyltetrahydrofolate cyclohydrolase [Actinokineospora sp. PR83]|uniref:bifunctional 5,10-methylenetetrahydrofolate dehydrogenase/5,10-methenyltetrahydrofolate cyclohydrolase n=1 Tax=Actinokineospora sp. PR83 TaxID=2884908 RepID=UPI0027DF1B0A|nr:bifunctional 5,10-methylenetetrahydrofolate dehydrogenase/5,10-methenyltetrahydrofolate cyclohydrolase [Actinokineospora sp. PR83]MCG8919310.1 bifunctional 5,10-methylenetetrahydrofolate dehydrogenase/5,10-methenyltetrahydrofolate cyclohydrolase [Actinokineospora sp. PR83]